MSERDKANEHSLGQKERGREGLEELASCFLPAWRPGPVTWAHFSCPAGLQVLEAELSGPGAAARVHGR